MDNQAQTDLALGDWRHRILVGVDYQRTGIDQVSFSGGSAPPLSVYDPVSYTHLDVYKSQGR